jgi:hypothetical protein
MKKLITITSILTLTIFSFSLQYGCKKSSSTPTVDSVNPSDATILQGVLIIPGGTLKTGTVPTTSASNAPVLSGNQTTAAINPNHQLMLPFNYTSTAGISKIILQVVNATGYIEITGSSSTSNTGTIVLPIMIPGKVKYGNFSVIYIIIDNSGNVSNVLTTEIIINAPVTCATATVNGAEGLTFTNIDMTGKASGTMSLNYDTYSVPDRIDVYQNGTWLTGTGTNPNSTIPPQCDCSTPLPGFIGATGTLTFPFDANKSKDLTVVVSGCLGGGTAWTWTMVCP